jgi:hypothetical protein
MIAAGRSGQCRKRHGPPQINLGADNNGSGGVQVLSGQIFRLKGARRFVPAPLPRSRRSVERQSTARVGSELPNPIIEDVPQQAPLHSDMRCGPCPSHAGRRSTVQLLCSRCSTIASATLCCSSSDSVRRIPRMRRRPSRRPIRTLSRSSSALLHVIGQAGTKHERCQDRCWAGRQSSLTSVIKGVLVRYVASNSALLAAPRPLRRSPDPGCADLSTCERRAGFGAGRPP